MSRTSTALPVVLAVAGLALVGCGDSPQAGRAAAQVTATATTNVRTTSHSETPPTTPATTPAVTPADTAAEVAATTPAPTTTSAERPAPAPEPAPEPVAPVKTEVEVAEAEVFNLTNAERTANGCPALGVDERLDQAARGHSADMAAQNYFDHKSKDGRTFVDRIRAAGHPAPGAENIAAGQRTPKSVVKGWMESPGHRANILNCKLKTLGVGMARGGSYGVYWTQAFGW
ncbi:CAP domain-containing protein [Actinosynnema sp. NPDC047251]|uniref:SCP-like extracellular n=1 Tax=Saccharothrix espanaensis (strain ATCC 51144 / DSM 44229 / JCM 9112 / NBRC 15066 / NRRL 15764) TaxID=1179773 RepID=K0K8Z8_SACES|nr:CAP domain-containing protein [Saccharothrix espanaensis]CCH33314.1 SCP-like extracellular [Saccharothrix espanaensis DSM 44229]